MRHRAQHSSRPAGGRGVLEDSRRRDDKGMEQKCRLVVLGSRLRFVPPPLLLVPRMPKRRSGACPPPARHRWKRSQTHAPPPPQTPQQLSLPSRTREPWAPQRCPPLLAEQGRAVAPRTMGNCPSTAPPAATPGREQTGNKGSAVGALGPPPPVCLGRGRRGHGGTKGGVPLSAPALPTVMLPEFRRVRGEGCAGTNQPFPFPFFFLFFPFSFFFSSLNASQGTSRQAGAPGLGLASGPTDVAGPGRAPPQKIPGPAGCGKLLL